MTTVSTTIGTRRRLRVPTAARRSGRTALAGLVVALVVGILGMHGLASHGTHADPAAVSDTMSMRSAEPHTANAATGTATDDLAGLVMLCGVMLAAALTLLALLAVGFFRPLRPAAFLPAAARERTVQWVRGAGPPSVWQFSVSRC